MTDVKAATAWRTNAELIVACRTLGYLRDDAVTTAAVDERYGVDAYASREDRHDLIRAGMKECTRVLAPGGSLLVKCQDQVNGGRVRWQTIEFANYGVELGLELVDMLHMLGGRPQPPGRRQEHARRNYSTLLVFRAAKAKRGRRA